jgi:hypothetical protein
MRLELKRKTIDELKEIIEKDYKVSISDNEARELGISLLRLSKLATIGLARLQEKCEANKAISNSIKLILYGKFQ